jgi:transcriptional regulator GlxA family with amidase domain
LTPDLLQSFNRHVFDLVASILGATRGGGAAAEAEAGGVKAARLRTVLSAIAARASEPTFGIETLAAELAVTARYIQRILGETGRTFSEHLLDQRLRRAWQLLTDPRSRNLKVASVAFDCGFSDISTFNRTFRRRFGETPTAIRGAALDGALP